TSDIAVLVFSLLSAESRAKDAGADAFLPKPLSPQLLKERVRSVLHARSTKPESKSPATRELRR
ncbi:MAG TPA: hypothetical protein VJU17_01075, partial [Gemmatimonadales bacterium]|nr:hypothetical protein [Gemmatimonadales bacterium]